MWWKIARARRSRARAPGRTPGMTQTKELATDGHERFASLPSPCIDLHTSVITENPGNGLAVGSHSSCKNRRRECRLPAKKREGAPEGAVFCALRNLELPPEFLSRSVKCAAFDADLSTRHRHPAGREEVWRRAKRLLRFPRPGARGRDPSICGRLPDRCCGWRVRLLRRCGNR